MMRPARVSLFLACILLLVTTLPGEPPYFAAAGSPRFPSGPLPDWRPTASPTSEGISGARGPAPSAALASGDEGPSSPEEDGNGSYWTYDNMTSELKQLEKEHPNIFHLYDLTSWIDNRFGFKKTWEGRSVWGVRISSAPEMNATGRPKLIIECSHHGDEWMGIETGRKLIEVLVGAYGHERVDNVGGINSSAPNWSTDRLSWLVDNRDIWVVPMVNPDGTTYDQQVAPSGGIWRKNMRDNDGDGSFDSSIDGVDINRNYPYMWGANMKGAVGPGGITITQDTSWWGSSQYHGPQDNYDDDGDARFPGAPDWWPQHRLQDWNGIDEDPVDGQDSDGDGKVDEDRDGGFSEPETCALEALFDALDPDGDHVNGRSDVTISVSLHSTTGCVMWPWGYTDQPAPDASLLEEIGTRMAEYPGYDAYQSVNMYPTSGDTCDWFYGSMGALAFVIELGKSGQGGFHPPVSMRDNISVPNVESLLYAAEAAEVARAAHEMGAPSLEIGVPEISHTPRDLVEAGKECPVEAKVTNESNLGPSGLRLFYRVNGGTWFSNAMRAGSRGGYIGSIPAQDGGSTVDYYLRASSRFNTTSLLPSYAPYARFTYRVSGAGLPLWGAAAGGGLLVAAAAAAGYFWKRRHSASRLHGAVSKAESKY